MKTSSLIFLYTVEEKSISKGADKAHISQQCASRHLQNLEKEYGTSLFNRRPNFTLTEAGKILFASLQQIHILEEKTKTSIKEITKEQTGQLRLGLNASRAKLLLPSLFEKYNQLYPKISFSVTFKDTNLLIRDLKKGDLDLLLSVNYKAEPQLTVLPLFQDEIFFIASKSLCQTYLSFKAESSTLTMKDISHFPLVLNLPNSTLRNLLQHRAAQENISLQVRYTLSDYDQQILLSGRSLAGAFCPQSLLSLVNEYNVKHKNPLRIFNIADLKETLHIDLIRNATDMIPLYECTYPTLRNRWMSTIYSRAIPYRLCSMI